MFTKKNIFENLDLHNWQWQLLTDGSVVTFCVFFQILHPDFAALLHLSRQGLITLKSDSHKPAVSNLKSRFADNNLQSQQLCLWHIMKNFLHRGWHYWGKLLFYGDMGIFSGSSMSTPRWNKGNTNSLQFFLDFSSFKLCKRHTLVYSDCLSCVNLQNNTW